MIYIASLRFIFTLAACSFLMAFSLKAQQPQRGGGQDRPQQPVEVKGRVVDPAEKVSLPGAHLQWVHQRDSSRVFNTTTDVNGNFSQKLPRGRYTLKVSYIGYSTSERIVTVFEEVTDLGAITLSKASALLQEVTIAGEAVIARQKGDTIQFDAQAFKTNPDATAEDLVRKLPGVTIGPDGVQAQGETVRRVLVDGQEFFGDDPNIALRNLPAEMIGQVEVFDQMSDQSRLTGFDDGERIKTINIVTRQDRRNGQFGKVYAGFGENQRYQAGVTSNIFLGKRRISFLGMTNNVNQQNFSSEDLSGFMASSGRDGGQSFRGMGGGGRPPGGSFGGVTFGRGDFLVGQERGNNTTHSLGVNYTDIWKEKVNVNASYFFNISDNKSEQIAERQYFLGDNNTQLYADTSNSGRFNQNHRVNARIDYKINENHNLLIIPRFSFQETSSDSYSAAVLRLLGDQLLSNSFTAYNRDWNGFSLSNAMIYRIRMGDKGRSFSARVNMNRNNNEYLYFLDALSGSYVGPVFTQDLIDQKSNSQTLTYGLSSNITYTEPVGKKGMIQLSYNISYSDNVSERLTNSWDIVQQSYSLLEPELSSELTNGYLTNRMSAGYRFRTEKWNILAEMGYQQAELKSDQTLPYVSKRDYTFWNYIPSVQFNYTFSRSESLRLMYRSFTNPPSVNQLQDVVDNSNPLLISSGNPNLKQSTSHFLSGRYNLTKVQQSKTFFAFFFGSLTDNYIGNSVLVARNDTVLGNGYTLPKGAQYSQPINMSGFYNFRSSLNYGFRVKPIKSNLTVTAGLALSAIPSMINGQSNSANSITGSGGLQLSSNISPELDFTLAYRMNYQLAKNTIRPNLDNNYFYHVSELRFNYTFLKHWVLRNDLSNLYYTGLGEGYNELYWLWNINFGRKVFANKRGELTLGVYDLLNQNKSVSRNITDTYIEDTRFNVLNRFVMLTFTYNFRNFSAASRGSNPSL